MRRLNPAGRAARELGEASTHGEPGHLRGDGGEVVRGESQLASRLPEWRDLKESGGGAADGCFARRGGGEWRFLSVG